MTKNIPIIGKFLLFIALFGAIFIASTCFSARESRQTASGFESAINRDGRASLFVARGSSSLMEARAAIGDLLVSNTDEGNRRALDELATARKAFISDMETASQAARTNAAGIAALAAKGVRAIDVTCKQAIDMGAAATTPVPILASQAVFLQTCSPVLLDVAAALAPVARDAAEEEQALAADLTRSSQNTVVITMAVAFGSLIVVSLVGFLTIRAWVSRPIKTLAATMMRLAGGELATAIDGTERRDEVGLMAHSLQIFKDNAIKARTLEEQAATMRDAAEAERGRNAEQAARRAAEQADVVTSISTGLSRLAKGALTFRIERQFTGEYDKLRTDFNAAMAKLQDTITVVIKNTSAIGSGTGEMSTAADDLARRTEQQAASLEETAAALDEITATVRKTADGSKHARDVVSATRQGTGQSADIVRQAIEAMSGIERSSGQIGQIIGVIDEIAFQTSLLALNAGVEAARAGDAGRGFAVVASEVRALAQRSAEAAKEIKTLISASSAEVGRGVHLVAETGKGLERIVIQVTEISGIIDDIAVAAHAQASRLDQVNMAVNQMDKVTQQNAAMVEQSNAASHALFNETEGLSRVIAGFTVDEDAAALHRPVLRSSGSRSFAKTAA